MSAPDNILDPHPFAAVPVEPAPPLPEDARIVNTDTGEVFPVKEHNHVVAERVLREIAVDRMATVAERLRAAELLLSM